MRVLLGLAALLTIILAAAHSYLGERFIIVRLLRRNDLPKLFGSDVFTKRTLRFAWHITTVLAVGMAALLFSLARPVAPDALTIAQIISITFMISGVVAVVGSRGRHLSWVIFFAVGVMAWIGLR